MGIQLFRPNQGSTDLVSISNTIVNYIGMDKDTNTNYYYVVKVAVIWVCIKKVKRILNEMVPNIVDIWVLDPENIPTY